MPPRPLIRSSRVRPPSSRWVPEAVRASLLHLVTLLRGGLVMACALVLTFVLLSYNPNDPSWNTATATGAVIHNWFGVTGSHTADVIWQFFGGAGFLLPLVLTAWGWRIATGGRLEFLPWRLLAGFLAVLSFGIGLSVMHPAGAWGGALGKISGDWLIHWIPWGRYVIAAVTLLVTLSAIYMACALSLFEWHALLRTVRAALRLIVEHALAAVGKLWHRLRRDRTDDDLPLDEAEPEANAVVVQRTLDDDAQETAPAKIAPEKTSAKKAKGQLVQRPAATARQPRLPLQLEGAHMTPPLELLQWPDTARQTPADISEDALLKNAKLLESVLGDFGVRGTITRVSPGPVVTLYELEPAAGVRSSRVISLADDIARNMSAASVRVAVVPGRTVIGIEMPNKRRETVYLRELLSSDAYTDHAGSLPLVLGKDISGTPVIADLARMPHLLVAGTTGSGKSVAINTMILSLLYRLPPQKCRFIMIDPKMLELSVYEGIPHLLAPVVTEPKKAIMALKWTVREMEERYRAMSKLGVRNIEGYNIRLREAAKNGENLMRTVQTGFDRDTGKPIYEEQPLDLTPLPFIVVIVDEMADLMIVAGKDIEGAMQRLAQMARAAGIHIIMATQRPSVDVITGTIKANFPTRISFQVTSKIDSRTILNEQGAEQLLGQGDMLYTAGGSRVTRVHGPFVRDDEVEHIVKFLKKQGAPEYLSEVTEETENGDSGGDGGGSFFGGGGGESNDLYDKAVDVVLRERKASISFVQRHLSIGYNRAATLIERMEREGIISSANHVGKRDVLGRRPDED